MTAKLSLGDLFPAAPAALFPEALIGGWVADWKYRQKSKFVKELPWDWSLSAVVFLPIISLWCAVSLLPLSLLEVDADS
ncbi:MAG: hypothetical protein AAF191_07005 [Verrucomicrobiota bacterium]